MKSFAFLLGVTALGVVAVTATANAGQRVVTRTSPHGGTMTTTQDCVPGASRCDRSMQATGAYGRTVSGSATVDRAPGQSVTTGSVVGPNGGVYNRTVTRNW